MPIVLRDYQNKIINELKHLPAYALYMGTGTGKTITSLELVKHNPTSSLLVVCPNSALKQWKNTILSESYDYNIIEIKSSWGSSKINEILKSYRNIPKTAFITNYEMVYRLPFLEHIVTEDWTIIADEIHRIKNYGTTRSPVKSTRMMLLLSNKTPYKVGLSATPTQGNYGGYIDYFTQIRFLGYTDLNYNDYYNKYVVYENKSYGTSPYPIKTIVGYKCTREIDNLLKLFAKRYQSKNGDFEPQFNKIIVERSKNYAKLVREKAYINDEVKIVLSNQARSRIAKKTMTTGVIYGRDMLGNPQNYLDNTVKLDWIRDFLIDTDEIVAIFYSYNVEMDSLKIMLESIGKKYIVVNGATKDKHELVNYGEYDVVIGQFRAMSEALDGLQHKCHIEIFFSMPESSLVYTQAIGRIDRIGQEKVPMYYFLIMEKTLDEEIMKNIEQKIEFSEYTLNKLEV